MDSGNVRVDGTSLQRGTPPSVAAPASGEGAHAATLDTLPRNVSSRILIDEAGCWLWQGATIRGYGEVKSGPKIVRVHRLAFEALRGPIPTGLVLDHLCRVRHCANPWHMEPVTNRENLLRGEGFPATNARKTHCIRGHEFTPENTRRHPKGRNCRACARLYYERRKSA